MNRKQLARRQRKERFRHLYDPRVPEQDLSGLMAGTLILKANKVYRTDPNGTSTFIKHVSPAFSRNAAAEIDMMEKLLGVRP